ncbi:MAG: flagellar biosynthetic protein FliQ [Planctomycetes bacterium]|nr:flagellar biosynthetic protein FliQ [Planctomycetota bacterium]
MDESVILDLAEATLLLALKIVAPALLVGLFVGLLISLFQTLTSLNEQTLALVPKMIAVTTTLLLLLPWILGTLRDFARTLLLDLSSYGPPV